MSFAQFTHDNIPALPDGPDDNIPQQPQFRQGGVRPTDGIPQFEVVPVRQKDGSYKNVEFVSIITPGDPKAVPRHKVTDTLRDMYRPYYEMWRKGLEISPHGTPLEMFPRLTPAQVRELKALNIFTVEQLADIADANIHRMPMGATLKKEAGIWMKSKKETDAIEATVRENQALKDGMSALERQISDLSARLEAQEQEKADQPDPVHAGSADMSDALSDAVDKAAGKKKPGRPKKEA